ncbi:MAG: NYN domain-containing protein [Chlamydiales bacterium]|nr:NYN domain-containing protein [Chlamydiales bacterium]
MHYLIDAYNLLFFLTKKVNPIEKSRQDLIDALTSDLEHLKIKATLVFDSGNTHQAHFPHRHTKATVDIVFSPEGICADKYILEILENTKNPHDVTVVTSDRQLSNQCKELQAKIQSVEKFLGYLKKRHHKKTALPEKPQNSNAAYNAHLQKIFEERLDEM